MGEVSEKIHKRFRLKETPGSSIIKLHAKHDHDNIAVAFDIQVVLALVLVPVAIALVLAELVVIKSQGLETCSCLVYFKSC